jgi:hypothetical protein
MCDTKGNFAKTRAANPPSRVNRRLRLREILLFILALLLIPLAARADEPSIVTKLSLRSTKSDSATLYYENDSAGDPKQALGAFEELLADLQRQSTIGDRADALVEQVNALVGYAPTPEQKAEQRDLLSSFAKLTNFLPKTLCIVRRSTIKDLLDRGETLPNFTYDRAKKTVTMNVNFDSKHPQTMTYFVMPLPPDTTLDQCVEQLRQMMIAGIPSTAIALHEVAELAIIQRLHPSTPYFRWFSDGFANTIAAKVLNDQVSPEAANDFLAMYDTGKLAELEKRVNLMWWLGKDAEIDTALKSEKELENARYAFATLEAKRLADKHGYDKIAAILTKASPAKANDPRDLFKAIQDVTGEDMRARLKRYQLFQTEKEGIELYANQFNALKAKGDLEGALSALLRTREIRGPNTLADYSVAGSMLVSLKQEAAADQMYQKLLDLLKRRKLTDQRIAALELYCDFALETKQPAKAADAAIEVLLSKPKSLAALTVRMLTLQQEARSAEARDLAGQILAIEQPSNSEYRREAELVRRKGSASQPSGSSNQFRL